tara:strand:- start:62 stop:1375 length:1314 start_codon:yes stop_codon:yes gene_type:complete
MFNQLQDRLSNIVKKLTGQGKISESNVQGAIRDVRRALLEADVNLMVVRTFIKRVQDKALGDLVLNSISPGQQFIKIVHDEMLHFFDSDDSKLVCKQSGITIIAMVGLQGVGKTTTCAKLASFLKNKEKKNPLMIGADIQRPAAIDQLEILGKNIDIPVFTDRSCKDVSKIVKKGVDYAKESNSNVVIIDTAGRLHINEELMDELKDIITTSNPDQIFYVADGMTGQDAVNSSKSFSDLIDISGIILTKMDGDSKGGAALSIREVTGKSIKFIGTGEKISSFELFYPDRIVKRILGMGDVVSLVEKAQEVFDDKLSKKLNENLLKNSFTLKDFQLQLKQFQKMGSMSDIMGMMPGMNKLKGLKVNEKQLVWIDAIINSMTEHERLNPNVINGSRRKRIALGSGRNVQEINSLLKQFDQMKTMIKKINKKGMFKFPLT